MKKKTDITREQLLRAFGETPPAFGAGIDATLRRLTSERKEPVMKRKLTLAPVLVLVLVLLAGMAVAAMYPGTRERFTQFYGEAWGDRLGQGDAAQIGASHTLGDVTYTVVDVIYEGGRLFGTVVMEPAEGANVVLIPEDTDVNDPMGVNVGYGETAPEGAKSYREVAKERGAKILLAKCVPAGYVLDGTLLRGDIGYFDTATPEGAILSSFELHGQNGMIEQAERYELRLSLHNWEITPEGERLREEPNNTWKKAEWDVTVEPVVKERAPEETPAPVAADGMAVMTPDGYDGKLPEYQLTEADLLAATKPEMITGAKAAQEKSGEGWKNYTFEDDDLMQISREDVYFYAYEGTEEITYETEKGKQTESVPRDELPEYLYTLASWERFITEQSSCYERPGEVADLAAISLADAKAKLEALLAQMGVKDVEMAYACAVDMAYAKPLSDKRNTEIAEGKLLNNNPYDLSGMTEQDEGYYLVYKAAVDGVPVSEEYLSVSAFVNADGIRHLSLRAPYRRGEAGKTIDCISAEDALAAVVHEAGKSWIPEMAQRFEKAMRAELAYSVYGANKLVPTWHIYALDSDEGEDVWITEAVVDAGSGKVLSASWL